MSAEIKIPIVLGDGLQQIQALASVFERLVAGTNGVDRNLSDVTDEFRKVATEAKIADGAIDAFLQNLQERSQRGTVSIRNMVEAMKGATGEEGLSGEQVRLLTAQIGLYKQAADAVQTYTDKLNQLIAAGQRANLGKTDMQAYQIVDRLPVTSEQIQSINAARGNVASTNTQLDRERVQNEMNAMWAEQQRRANEFRSKQEDAMWSQMRTGQDNESSKGTDAAYKDRNKRVADENKAFLSMETKQAEDEKRVEEQRLRQIAENAKARADAVDKAAREELRARERAMQMLQGLEDRAALAGAHTPSERAAVQRGITMRGFQGTGMESRAGAAIDAIEESGGSGGIGYGALRGIVQTGMGLGIGDYRLYYLMNGLYNMNSGHGLAGALGMEGSSGMVAGAVGGGVAGAGLLAMEFAAARSASQQVRELRNMGMEMGTTTQGARELQGMSSISGTSLETVSAGMRQLTQGIAESGGRGIGTAAVLKQIGVSPESNGQLKDTKQLLFEISDAIKGMSDIQARDILERLFGRGGREMLPMMRSDMRELASEVHNMTSGLDDDKALRFASEMSKLGIIYDTLKQKFAEPLFMVMDVITGGGSADEIDRLRAQIAAKGKTTLKSSGKNMSMNDLINAGAGKVRQAYIDRSGNTLEGMQERLRQDEEEMKRLDSAARTPPGQGQVRSDKEQEAMNKQSEDAVKKVEADKAAIKIMQDHGATLLQLQREAAKAQEGELSGYQKINAEIRDKITLLKEANHNNGLPTTAAELSAIDNYGTALRQNYAAKVAAGGRANSSASVRTLTSGNITDSRRIAAAVAARNRAGSGITGTTVDSINEDYALAIGNAEGQYQLSMQDVIALQQQYGATPASDMEGRNRLRSQINTQYQRAGNTLGAERDEADLNRQRELLKLWHNNTEAARHYYDSVTEGAVRATEADTRLGESLLKNRMRGQLNIMRSRSALGGNSAGASGLLADQEFSTQMSISGMEWNSAITGAQNSLGLENRQHDTNMASPNMIPGSPEWYAEKSRHEREIGQMRAQLEQQLGQIQEGMDNAHIERQKTSIDLMREQNEQVKEFAGNLIGAYIQAELHRQPGSFPMRQALGQYYTQWGETIGKNAIGTGFGMLQQLGVGGSDIIPGLTHQVANDIDPATGRPAIVSRSNDSGGVTSTSTHSSLTALGKVLQGTPLGHRPGPADLNAPVLRLDSNLADIKDLLHRLFDNVANSGGYGGDSGNTYGSSGGTTGTDPLASLISMGSSMLPPSVRGSAAGSGITSGLGLLGGFSKLFKRGGSSAMSLPISSGWGGGYAASIGAINNNYDPNAIVGRQSGGIVSGVDESGNATFSTSPGFITAGGAASNASPSAAAPHQISKIDTGSKGSILEGVANVAAIAASDINTTIDAAKQMKSILSGATGKSGAGAITGALGKGMGAAAQVASSIPGGQIVGAGLEIGALVLGGISAIFGNPRKDRERQLEYDSSQHQFTAPSAYNLVTSTSGMSVTTDLTGAPRSYRGPLLAYPNTNNFTAMYDYAFNAPRGTGGGGVPGGVTPVGSTILSVQINALDSKSVMDHAHQLTDAVQYAINGGHPIRNAISAVVNPR